MPTNDHATWKANRDAKAQGLQRCPKCENALTEGEFNPSDRGKSGTYCTTCKREANRARYVAKGATTAPDAHRERAYRMSPSEYRAMRRNQHDRCAICTTSLVDLPRRLVHVDHDHTTGAARGILCFRCNVLVGAARDSVAILQAIIAYLTR